MIGIAVGIGVGIGVGVGSGSKLSTSEEPQDIINPDIDKIRIVINFFTVIILVRLYCLNKLMLFQLLL